LVCFFIKPTVDTSKMNEEFIINLIKNDPWRMDVLRAVRSLNLPDWLIGAGFIRNPVWDALHGFNKQTPITDIDVVYFDPNDQSEDTEKRFQEILYKEIQAEWSVTNQARMAKLNNQSKDYTSTTNAIAHWPETATAIGIAMLTDDSLRIIAPHGLQDLFSLTVRMTPDFGSGRVVFLNRVHKKQWLSKWPKLRLLNE